LHADVGLIQKELGKASGVENGIAGDGIHEGIFFLDTWLTVGEEMRTAG